MPAFVEAFLDTLVAASIGFAVGAVFSVLLPESWTCRRKT